MRRVVITGMGCLSPNGNGKHDFFQALAHGRSGIRRISHFDPDALDCKIAGELQNFDPLCWISRKDQPHVARTVPMAIAAAHEALQDAALDPGAFSLEEQREFGILIGSGGGAVEFAERQYELFMNDPNSKQVSVYAVPSNTMGTLASELSMRFNLKGLSHVISTGCTSSTDALGYAYHHIQAGRLERVLAGGVDAPITPGVLSGFNLMKVTASGWNDQPELASRPFSVDRNGFVLSEGAWLFVLEERKKALARGARVYAEIRGYGATCDAYHRVRMDESGTEAARAMQLAMREAKISAANLNYINLHGTSTQLNDRVETRAVKHVGGTHASRIPMSSTKSMIGHPQGACGAAGVMATLFSMETGLLPPTINLTHPDPECDLDYVPDAGRKHAVEWALNNCIGFGSKNSALLLHRGENL